MLERDIEHHLVRRVRGLGGLCLKFVSPGSAGLPDRLVLLPGGGVAFVELKRPGQRPGPLQLHMLAKLRQLGCRVAWFESKAEIDAFLA